jgi:hypothetical protein
MTDLDPRLSVGLPLGDVVIAAGIPHARHSRPHG